MKNQQIATVSINETQWYGSARNNYTYFDDKQFLPISLFNYKVTKVKIWYGNIYKEGVVNGIQFYYRDRSTKMAFPTKENYGALYLISTKEYELGHDEYLTSFTIQAMEIIEYLSFTTSKNRIIEQGIINKRSPVYSFEYSNSCFIVGIKGFYSNYLNKIAFYYVNKDYYLSHDRMNHSTVSCTSLYGDMFLQGTWFNDKEILKDEPMKYRIIKLVFWIRKLYHSHIINGIQFVYCKRSSGKIIDSIVHSGKNKEDFVKEYSLEDDEYITHYQIKTGHLVEYIKFTTNKGRIIQEGEMSCKEQCQSQFGMDDKKVILALRGEYEGDLQNVSFYYTNVYYYEQVSKFYALRNQFREGNDGNKKLEKYKDDLSTLALIKAVILLKPYLCRNILTYLRKEDFPIFGYLFLSKSSENSSTNEKNDSVDLTPSSVADFELIYDSNRLPITPSFSFAYARRKQSLAKDNTYTS